MGISDRSSRSVFVRSDPDRVRVLIQQIIDMELSVKTCEVNELLNYSHTWNQMIISLIVPISHPIWLFRKSSHSFDCWKLHLIVRKKKITLWWISYEIISTQYLESKSSLVALVILFFLGWGGYSNSMGSPWIYPTGAHSAQTLMVQLLMVTGINPSPHFSIT